MHLVLAADHRGFQLKESLKRFLVSGGHEVEDAGDPAYNEHDDYVDFARIASEKIVADPERARGIFICGTGIGMDVVANKYRGLRAALVHDRETAVQSREHGDTNVLVLAADTLDEARAREIVTAFLDTSFSGEERHVRRLAKIREIEEKNFK